MQLDLYTQNAGLTQKAKFWCNYVSALKGKFNYLFKRNIICFILKLASDLSITRIRFTYFKVAEYCL